VIQIITHILSVKIANYDCPNSPKNEKAPTCGKIKPKVEAIRTLHNATAVKYRLFVYFFQLSLKVLGLIG